MQRTLGTNNSNCGVLGTARTSDVYRSYVPSRVRKVGYVTYLALALSGF